MDQHEDVDEHHIHKCKTTIIKPKQRREQPTEEKLKPKTNRSMLITLLKPLINKNSRELAKRSDDDEPEENDKSKMLSFLLPLLLSKKASKPPAKYEVEESVDEDTPILTRHTDLSDHKVTKCITTIMRMRPRTKPNTKVVKPKVLSRVKRTSEPLLMFMG